MTEQKLLPIDHCRHLAFAAIGGFFGGYALLCRGGILGSSQTMNLVELVIDALFGRGSSVLLHLLCLVIYVVGVMLSVIIPHVFHVDMRRLSPCITAAAAIAMGFFPADMTPLVALYPVFFSMSIQWSTFAGARGFQSATIFNSNNTKQASLALAHYLCEGEREQLTKLWFYGSTLLAFHAGAVWSWLAVKWLDVRGVWGVLPQLALAYYLVLREEQAERVLTPAQIRQQEVLGEAEELVEEAEELVEEEKED